MMNTSGVVDCANDVSRNMESGSWRALRINDGVLHPPSEGWERYKYVVVGKQQSASVSDEKERREERVYEGAYREREPIELGITRSSNKEYGGGSFGGNRPYNDLIVLGLKWEVTEDELKGYFSQYGEVDHAEVKFDTFGKSKGFGFLRFRCNDVQNKVMKMSHTIRGRRCELKLPRKSPNAMPCKFFVGCLPNDPEATTDELESYFSQFGQLSDVYIPKPYRGFGFVTFMDGFDAERVKPGSGEHSIRGYQLNISIAEPKDKGGRKPPPQQKPPQVGALPQIFAATNFPLVHGPQGNSYQTIALQPPPPPPSSGSIPTASTFTTDYMHGYSQQPQRYYQ